MENIWFNSDGIYVKEYLKNYKVIPKKCEICNDKIKDKTLCGDCLSKVEKSVKMIFPKDVGDIIIRKI